MKRALLLVDLQNEWADKDSPYHVSETELFIKHINELISNCRKRGYKIIFIRHVEEEGESFKEGTSGAELMKELDRNESDIVITKNHISPFYKTKLEKELKGIKGLAIAGILTNLCVRMSVEGAYDRGFDITLIEDCCLAMDDETHKFTLKDLKTTREEITITRLERFTKR